VLLTAEIIIVCNVRDGNYEQLVDSNDGVALQTDVTLKLLAVALHDHRRCSKM
jgi:hypothetical protein